MAAAVSGRRWGDSDFPVGDDSTTATPGTEVLDFLAARLARLLAERSSAGLHRAYAERSDSGPFLQGRLDLPAQLHEPAGRKDALHCRYEDFTVDVPCNQVGNELASWPIGQAGIHRGYGAPSIPMFLWHCEFLQHCNRPPISSKVADK